MVGLVGLTLCISCVPNFPKEQKVSDSSDSMKFEDELFYGYDSLYDPGYFSTEHVGVLPKIKKFEREEPLIGFEAFKKYLKDSLRYPKEALEKRKEGRVMADLTIDANGRVYFNAIWGFGSGSEKEVMRLIKSAGVWKPFKNLDVGKTSASSQIIFVDFQLPDSLKKK